VRIANNSHLGYMTPSYELGKKGEQLAIAYLVNRGYQILEENWRFQKSEIDIIATKKKTLISVEVKTRSSDFFGNPQEAVNPKKIKHLVKAMNRYVLVRGLDVEVRFDVIAIIKSGATVRIEHLKDAFLYF